MVWREFGAESKTSSEKGKSGDALNFSFEGKGPRMREWCSASMKAGREGIRMTREGWTAVPPKFFAAEER